TGYTHPAEQCQFVDAIVVQVHGYRGKSSAGAVLGSRPGGSATSVQQVIETLVQGSHAERSVKRLVDLQDIFLGAIRAHLDRLTKPVGRLALSSRGEGIVPVSKPLRGSQGVGIVPQVDVEHQGRRHGLFVKRPHLSATVCSRIAGTAGVAIVEEYQ